MALPGRFYRAKTDKRKKVAEGHIDSGLNSAVEVTCPTGLKTGKPPKFIPTANVSRIGVLPDGSFGVK